METSGGIRASLAGRYASALFDLARDQRQIDAVGRSLDALGQALLDSKDFAELVGSPLVSREEAGKAFAALAPQLGLDPNKLTYFYSGLDQKLVGVEGAEPIKQVIA